MMLKVYLWIMGWSGQLNAWAWRKQCKIIKDGQKKEKTLSEILDEGFKKEQDGIAEETD